MIKTTASNLPRGWRIDNISNLTNNLDNRRIPLNQEQRSEKEGKGSYPYVGANNIVGYIDEFIFDEKILCIAEDGGSWGYNETCAYIMNEKCWVNNHAHVLTAKENLVLEYLKYYLNYADLNLYINGATRGKLNQSALNKIEIPLPPLPEQQKIAAILDAADSLRQKDQQLVERYTALSQSLFLEMFGDPVTNPMGWETLRISDVCRKVTDGTHQSPRFISEGIPFLLVSNIVNNQISFKTKKFISEVDYDALTKNTPIEKSDILYTSVGSYGNPAIVEVDTKFCFQRHIAHLKPNHQIINVKFLHSMLLSSYVKNQADKLARGVAQKTLNLKEIKSLEIYLPSFTTQIQFAERVQLIEAQKQQAQASLEKSEALFNSLLQRAFTGELTAKMAA